jgi:hypothetical protein
MNDSESEKNLPWKIVETQEESEEDDELVFWLSLNGEVVSWAKTLPYSYLKEIHTIRMEKRKGHPSKLPEYIEKKAKANGATKMKTGSIDPMGNEASDFFEDMGYELAQNDAHVVDSVFGTKKL